MSPNGYKRKGTSRENLSQDIKVFVFSTLLNIVNGFIIINYRGAEQDFPSVKMTACNKS